jgi:GT2 family glycosyltransferase
MCVKRAAVDDVGLLDEGYGMYSEEIDWSRRFAERGWSILLAPAARVTHHGGQSTAQRGAEMHEALWSSRARYLERWATPRQRRLASAVVTVGMHWQDFRAGGDLRATNTRIRERFRDIRSKR